jgi:hypothetical protein
MEFNNLRRMILVTLGYKWREVDTLTIRSIRLKTFQAEYADIPEGDFEASIQSLEDEGLIRLSQDCRSISLTHKGLDHLRIIYTDKKDEEIIVAEKLT